LNFQGRTNTGLYSPAAGQVALTAGGYEALNVTAATSSVNYLQVAASSTGADPSLSALGSDTNISWDLIPKGSGKLKLTNPFTTTAAFSGGTIDNIVIGGITPSAITGTSITGTTITGTTLVASSAITTAGTISAVSTISGNSLISRVATGTPPLTVSSTTAVANLTANTVTTNANMTGDVTSVGNTTTVASIAGVAVHTPTGSGNVVFSNSPTFTGSPIAPTASVNTSNTQISTTAFANPGASLGTNGYVTLPCGLLIQWATGTNVTPGGSVTGTQSINFPISFPTGIYKIIVFDDSGAATALVYAHTSASLSATTIAYFNSSSGSSQGTPAILAIGH
jgi:hypothetical protein